MYKFIMLLFCLFCFVGTIRAQSDNETAIRNTFRDFNEKIEAQKGQEAVQYLDSKTIAYYDKILENARTADSNKVSQLPLMNKMLVLALRNNLSRQEIDSFTGKSFFAYSIDHKTTNYGKELGEIEIDGNQAKAKLPQMKTSDGFIVLNKEDGIWKVDLTSFFSMFEQFMNEKIKNDFAGDENQFCLTFASIGAKKPAGKEIWQPIE